MKQGVFITFEGNDGAGKTTVCKAVEKRLSEMGYSVLYTREPGGSRIAEAIRQVLLDVENTEMDARTEALLYAASRRQHLVEVVLPALNANKIVLCLDLEASAFHARVRKGYQTLCQDYPERITVIDAEADVQTVVDQSLQEILKVVHAYE